MTAPWLAAGLLFASVGLDLPDSDVAGAVALRLYDEGHTLTSPAPGGRRLSVRQTQDGLLFSVDGGPDRRVEGRTPRIRELALLQQVSIALGEPTRPPPASALRLDVGPGLRARWRSRAALAVLTAGRPLSARATTRLCIRARGVRGAVRLSMGRTCPSPGGSRRVRTPGALAEAVRDLLAGPTSAPTPRATETSTTPRAVARAATADNPPLRAREPSSAPGQIAPGQIAPGRIAPAQAAPRTEPVATSPPVSPRAAAEIVPPEPPPPVAPAPAAPPAASAPPELATSPPAPPPGPRTATVGWSWLARAAGEAQLRSTGADFGGSVGAQIERARIGLELSLGLHAASSEDVSALEVSAALGPTYTLRPTATLRLQGGVRLGALLHRYRFEQDTGLRADALLELPLYARTPLLEGLALELGVAPGTTFRSRRHELGDAVIWRRSAWRVRASVGLVLGNSAE